MLALVVIHPYRTMQASLNASLTKANNQPMAVNLLELFMKGPEVDAKKAMKVVVEEELYGYRPII